MQQNYTIYDILFYNVICKLRAILILGLCLSYSTGIEVAFLLKNGLS